MHVHTRKHTQAHTHRLEDLRIRGLSECPILKKFHYEEQGGDCTETNWRVGEPGNHLEESVSGWVSLGGRDEFRGKVVRESWEAV